MDYEKARKSVLSQGQDLWIKIWEETASTGKKRHLGGSGTCEGTPHEERKRKDDAI